jgi:transglutaminase-like putative cysteine protease
MLRLAVALALLAPAAIAAPYVSEGTALVHDDSFVVNADGTYTETVTEAERLNTPEGVENDGNFALTYSPSHASLKIFDAYTTTPNGQRIDVSPDKIIVQQSAASAGAPMFSDDLVKAVIYPGLTVGAVKHITYVLTYKVPLLPGVFSDVEAFNDDWTYQHATLRYDAPAGMKLFIDNVGLTPVAATASAGRQVHAYEFGPSVPLAQEPNAISTMDTSPRLAISNLADAAALGAAYTSRAADKAAVTPSVQALEAQITAGKTTPRAKAAALYDWVSRHIRYVALNLGDGGFVPRPADTILASGYGDCKDHVTILQALLSAAGIPSSGALISWSDSYWNPTATVPVYNHIITYIPQFHMFTDSTAQFAPFGTLPQGEPGHTVVVVGGQGIQSRAVALPLSSGASPDAEHIATTETVAANGAMTGSTQADDSGVYEFIDREIFSSIPPGTEPSIAAQLLGDKSELGGGSLTPQGDPHDLATPFHYASSFTLPEFAAIPGPGTMPVPLGVPVFEPIDNLAKLANMAVRHRPIACLPMAKEHVTTVTFPAGVVLLAPPPATDVANAMGAYTASYKIDGTTLTADRKLVLHTGRAVCGPAEYQQLRDLAFAINRDERATVSYDSARNVSLKKS